MPPQMGPGGGGPVGQQGAPGQMGPGGSGPIIPGGPGGQMNQNAPGQMPGAPPPGPPPGPPGSGQENLNALQKAIDSMEEKGLQEDPRYSQLIALRARQGNNMGDKQTFSSQQLQQLRYEIFYFLFSFEKKKILHI